MSIINSSLNIRSKICVLLSKTASEQKYVKIVTRINCQLSVGNQNGIKYGY